MTPERWQQIDKLYKSVVELEPSQQATFLKQACGGDAELRREVESLLAVHEGEGDFLDKPALEGVAQVLAKGQAQSLVGQQIGSYKILSLLGAGGMGEVYLAQDSRLGRKIAFKLLPPQFSKDEERVRRLEREARTASALNHPNIVTIYEMGQANSVVYIAMEFVEGKTLREVLGQGALPTKQMLQIAVQVADGLAKAHTAGITHRDLKPENLMVTKDGLVKILDFGLAKQGPQQVGSGEEAPTLSATATEPGVILGTVGYMSPEQASGLGADFRSDQFSLGAILYEMGTGKRAFQRVTAAETLSAVIREEPEPMGAVNPRVLAPLRWVVERCLAKDPQERYASTRDLARELKTLPEHLSELGSAEPAVAPAVEEVKRFGLFGAISLAVAVLAVLATALFLSRSINKPPPTFHQLTFRHGNITEARFAPDGQTIVYAAAWGGNPLEIYTVRLESPESGLLGLHNAGIFSISSSGEMAISMGCGLNWGECIGTLARVPLTGGTPRQVLENVYYADWSPDGKTWAVARPSGGRFRLEYPIGKVLYESPGWIGNARISPKGDLIAFFDHPTLTDISGSVCVVDLLGKKRTVSTGWAKLQGLAWAAVGDEIWISGSKAGPAGGDDLHAITLSGRERVAFLSPGYLKLFDISRDGRRFLVLRATPRAKLISSTPGSPKEHDLSWFAGSTVADLSVDGKTILFYELGFFGTYPIYLRKTDGSDAVRLGEGKPLALAPDGKWALVLQETLPPQLVLLPTGPGEQKLLPRGPIQEYLHWAAWSPDGSRIFFGAAEKGHRPRTYVQDMTGGQPSPVTAEGLEGALLSPDGKFIAAVDRYREYSLCPVAGGEPRPIEGLEEGDGLLQWSGDGHSLFVRAAGDLELKIYRLDLVTGRRELWKVLTPPDPTALISINFNPGEVRLTPDGKSYAYTAWFHPGELYTVEGLK